MNTYILYKNPIQLDTLHIVQYLHSIGINIIPKYCIERNHPEWVTELPSIETSTGQKYIGMDSCIHFYTRGSNIENIVEKTEIFIKKHPEYRINL
jgi:hypothetical protein